MDDGAFRQLFDAHMAEVWRYARRRCATATDADDVVAETFAVAWRRRADVPRDDAARLWLLGTARRVLANQRRSQGRQHRLRTRAAAVAPPPVAPASADRDEAGGSGRPCHGCRPRTAIC